MNERLQDCINEVEMILNRVELIEPILIKHPQVLRDVLEETKKLKAKVLECGEVEVNGFVINHSRAITLLFTFEQIEKNYKMTGHMGLSINEMVAYWNDAFVDYHKQASKE